MSCNHLDDCMRCGGIVDDLEERLESCEKMASLLVDAKNTEIARLMTALKTIRFAGQNDHPTAIWMQKVAAHAMEPNRWPKQPDKPPNITTDFRYER